MRHFPDNDHRHGGSADHADPRCNHHLPQTEKLVFDASRPCVSVFSGQKISLSCNLTVFSLCFGTYRYGETQSWDDSMHILNFEWYESFDLHPRTVAPNFELVPNHSRIHSLSIQTHGKSSQTHNTNFRPDKYTNKPGPLLVVERSFGSRSHPK